jgi:hypothetical protein
MAMEIQALAISSMFHSFHASPHRQMKICTSGAPDGTDGHRNCKTTLCMLDHERVKGATLTKSKLNVLHVNLHAILERLLVFWTQT